MRFPLKIVLLLILFSMMVMIGVYLNDPVPVLTEPNFVDPSQGTIRMTSQLYFVYDNMLRVERQRVSIKEGNYEASVLEALKNGPSNSRYGSIFDFGMDYLTVENINNTCYVNFTGPLLEETFESEREMTLFLWSVVNSLTELKSVMRVQLMYNGNPIDLELLGFSLLDPLPRAETLIYAKEQSSYDVVRQFIDHLYGGRYDLAYALLVGESQNQMDYLDFIQYANGFMTTYKEFKPVSGYAKVFPAHQIVYIRFEKPYEAGEFTLSAYDKWLVKREKSLYRIYLPPQMNF